MARYDAITCPSCSEKIPERATICRHCEVPTGIKKHENSNKFGVPGDIPADVTRAVRRECGFGCVVCGEMICHYDHFEPEYSDLRDEHKAANIALLCTPHHNYRGGKKPVISRARMRELRDNPFLIRNMQEPRTTGFFMQPGPSGIKLGGTLMRGATRLRVNGETALWFDEPVNPNDFDGVVQFGAEFQDQDRNTIARIENNVFSVCPQEQFDVDDKSSQVKISINGKSILTVSRYETSLLSAEDIAVLETQLASDSSPDWGKQLILERLRSDSFDVFDIEQGDFWFNGCHLEISKQIVKANGIVKFDGSIVLAGPTIDIEF